MHASTHIRALLVIHALALSANFAAAADVTGRVIAPDGAPIAGAVVFVEQPDAQSGGDKAQAQIDQINKTFLPAVLPVAVGTEVKFPNRDQIRHHVYSFSRAKRFELPLYKGEEAAPVLFDKPGVVKIGCNIHDWMSAVIIVVPNAHYALTGEDGRFKLSNLPAGDHAIAAWHAQAREKTEDVMQRVQLSASGVDLTFQLSLAPARARPAARGARWE